MSVQLFREGFDPVEVQVAQVTPAAVSSLFSLDSATVWVRDERGPKAFFPDATNRSFNFTSDVGETITSLVVEGLGGKAIKRPTVSCAIPSATPHRYTWDTPCSSRAVILPKKSVQATVKVVQASVSKTLQGKLTFTKKGQTFICVNEETANVKHIESVVQRKWGEDYVLSTADGLRIDDSSGTPGIKFWKVASRKVYAVKDTAIRQLVSKGKGRRLDYISISDSDSEFSCDEFATPGTSKKHADTMTAIAQLRKDTVDLITDLRQDISSVLKLTKGMSIPPGLQRSIMETFKCHICLATPIRPPAIFARCCRRIIGCEVCIEEWYEGVEGRSKTCPLCRADRAYSETTRVLNLDDFLTSISPLFPTGNDDVARAASSGESDDFQ